jgi:hypothetical protein
LIPATDELLDLAMTSLSPQWYSRAMAFPSVWTSRTMICPVSRKNIAGPLKRSWNRNRITRQTFGLLLSLWVLILRQKKGTYIFYPGMELHQIPRAHRRTKLRWSLWWPGPHRRAGFSAGTPFARVPREDATRLHVLGRTRELDGPSSHTRTKPREPSSWQWRWGCRGFLAVDAKSATMGSWRSANGSGALASRVDVSEDEACGGRGYGYIRREYPSLVFLFCMPSVVIVWVYVHRIEAPLSQTPLNQRHVGLQVETSLKRYRTYQTVAS